MMANPILLQKKYARVIECFAKQQGISLDEALDLFYRSEVYVNCASCLFSNVVFGTPPKTIRHFS